MSASNEPMSGSPLSVKAIDQWLPQTQCTRCGYPRCHDYATAIIRGETDINRCPPGGETTIAGLAELLQQPIKALDTDCGQHQPRVLALIVEVHCIGCTLCIQVCPVDAIVGRTKRMHTVLPALCTGCELCLPACPVDCIALVPDTLHQAETGSRLPEYDDSETRIAHRNTVMRLRRMARRERNRGSAPGTRMQDESKRIRAEIQAAVARVKEKREGR